MKKVKNEIKSYISTNKNAQVGMEEDNTVYSAAALDDAIIELEKVIAENDKMKNMGATAPAKEKPKDEIVNTEPFILQTVHEIEFWQKSYISALNCGYANPPQGIADMAVCELRKRLDEK